MGIVVDLSPLRLIDVRFLVLALAFGCTLSAMEISLVRRRVHEALARARQTAAARRAANDAAAGAWARTLELVAVPLVQQIAQVLKADGHLFQVFTPAGSVRISSEKTADDYVELTLDTSGERPVVLRRVSRRRGRELVTDERAVATDTPIDQISDEQMLGILLDGLAVLVER